jgi:dihydroflavonol-4-reductase
MKIAITGAAGLLGNNLCRTLLEQGHELRALIHTDSNSLDGLVVEKLKGDVLDIDSLYKLCDGVDAVFHCAAKISIAGDPDGSVFKVNVEGTKNIIAACLQQKVGRLVHFSSIHALQGGAGDELIDESTPYAGPEAFKYDQSKAQAEQLVLNAVKTSGLNAIVINPTGIIGPNDFAPSYTAKLLLDLYKGKIPALVNGGYDFLDVRDVVNTAIIALEKAPAGATYLLSGRWYSIKEIGATFAKISGKAAPRMIMPMWVAKFGLPFIQLWARLSKTEPLYTRESLDILGHGKAISHAKAKAELGFEPRGLEETIQDTWAFLKAHFISKD